MQNLQTLINERNDRIKFEKIIKRINDMDNELRKILEKNRRITKC